MKKVIRFFTSVMLVFCILAGAVVSGPDTAYAATAYVQQYSDMIGQGGYIYYIRTSEKDGSAVIWRMKVSTGETSKVVSESRGIVKLIVSGQQLYYTTVNDEDQWEVRTCRLNGDDVQTVCEGCVMRTASVFIISVMYRARRHVCM